MYKTDVIRRVARDTRLSKRAVADVVNSSLKLLQEALRSGQSVQFPGFGTFDSVPSSGGESAAAVRSLRVSYPACASFSSGSGGFSAAYITCRMDTSLK
jgi:hypothetical protein